MTEPTAIDPLATWYAIAKSRDMAQLDSLLADDVVFHSPIVHTPQRGRSITAKYLSAAFHVLFNESFRYVREISSDRDAVLEFVVEIDGISVNGIDIMTWNEAGKLTDFKVMLRPLQAVNLVHERMRAMLAGNA